MKLPQRLWDGARLKVSFFISKQNLNIFFSVHDLINELDPNHDGKITQEEFILIMSYIE